MLFLSKENKVVNWVCLILKRKYSQINTKVLKNSKIEPETNYNIFERRWEVLKETNDESKWFKFSLASYNVLSQNLLDNNKHLYKICQPRFLTWNYRKEALKKELTYYQPDIICLQEVHFHEFSRFFVPELQKLGYFGLYKKRTSAKEDGCATFFRHEKFCLEAFRYLEYHHKDVAALEPDNVGLLFLLKLNLQPRQPDPRPSDTRVDQTLHTRQPKLTDEDKERLEGFRLCVANTHLLFNPLRGEVKLAQLMTLMASVDDLNGEDQNATIVCGDFNSLPDSGLYKFAQSGRVECKDVDSKFFSGQLKPSPEECLQMSRRKRLSPMFLQKVTSITDQCQFVEVLKRRFEKNAEKTNSPPHNALDGFSSDAEEEEEEEVATSPFSFTQGSGVISHNLQLESVYEHSNYSDNSLHNREVSFFLEKNCSKVDYIFYSQTPRQKHDKICSHPLSQDSTGQSAPSCHSSFKPPASPPKEISLLRRLKLWTEAEVRSKYPTGMPNSVLGSDHLIMLAEFGVKLEK